MVLVLAMLVLAAGCVRIPMSGPVRYAEPSPTSRSSPPVKVVADGPRPGDSPSQVVHGFLEAMRSYHPDFPVARKFLAPSVRELWQPATVQVYDSDAGVSVASTSKRRLTIKAPKVAEIQGDGTWQPAGSGSHLLVHLRLTRIRGDWRIVNPPDALIMSRADVEREYGRYELYFYDPDFQTLVPDAVYLPVRGSVATLLVQALLGGPSRRLSPAVRTAFPTGSRLAASSVPVNGGVAQVDLNRRVLDLSDAQRRLIAAQLAWTLRQAAVQRLRITVDQTPLRIKGKSATLSVDGWKRYDPAIAGASTMAIAIAHHRVVVVGSQGLRPLPGPLGHGSVSVRSCAIDFDGERIAAVTSDGHKVLVAPATGTGAQRQRARTVLKGSDVLEPSWDREGLLWVVDRGDDGSRVRAVGPGGKVRRVKVPSRFGDIRGLAVSREGARVALLAEVDGRVRLEIGRIQREAGLRIEGLHPIPLPMTSMTDLAWSDVDELAVVGQGSGGLPKSVVVSSDGSVRSELGGAPKARTIAAAPGLPLLLGAADGKVYVENEQYHWVARGRGGRPAYPG